MDFSIYIDTEWIKTNLSTIYFTGFIIVGAIAGRTVKYEESKRGAICFMATVIGLVWPILLIMYILEILFVGLPSRRK